MWWTQIRERDLLQNGGIAEGRVTKQWLNKGNLPVAYDFTDFRGHTHRVVGTDCTKELYVGMPMMVFYDSNTRIGKLRTAGLGMKSSSEI